jgi:hypothetical protein
MAAAIWLRPTLYRQTNNIFIEFYNTLDYVLADIFDATACTMALHIAYV